MLAFGAPAVVAYRGVPVSGAISGQFGLGGAVNEGRLTTHVLDTTRGQPARGLGIDLLAVHDGHAHLLASFVTNDDGRVATPLLAGADFAPGTYELDFNVGPYFAKLGLGAGEPFLDIVPVRFIISEPDAHYHVPLLVSPYGYSTYRGS